MEGFYRHKIFWRITCAVIAIVLVCVNGYLYSLQAEIYEGARFIAEQSNRNAEVFKRLREEKKDNSEGKFCGGIAAFPCPDGYACKLDGSYPDAGGTCVKN